MNIRTKFKALDISVEDVVSRYSASLVEQFFTQDDTGVYRAAFTERLERSVEEVNLSVWQNGDMWSVERTRYSYYKGIMGEFWGDGTWHFHGLYAKECAFAFALFRIREMHGVGSDFFTDEASFQVRTERPRRLEQSEITNIDSFIEAMVAIEETYRSRSIKAETPTGNPVIFYQSWRQPISSADSGKRNWRLPSSERHAPRLRIFWIDNGEARERAVIDPRTLKEVLVKEGFNPNDFTVFVED
jgi:hypothetical protein